MKQKFWNSWCKYCGKKALILTEKDSIKFNAMHRCKKVKELLKGEIKS